MKVVSPAEVPLGSVKARTRQVPVGTAELSAIDSVLPPAHQRQRRTSDGIALPVAQQSGEVDGLVGAVDAALGIDKGIRTRRRHDASGDAAISKIEGIGLQAEEGV